MPPHSENADIVIIGAGLAGLFTALKLAPRPVTIVTTSNLGRGSASSWAQGGIAAAIGEGDSPEKHAIDTINAGAGLVDENIAHLIASEAPDRIEDLIRFGVPFDRNLEGLLALSREAAHSKRRIVRVKGDMAGRAIMSSLINAVKNTPSITVLENHEARDLITHNGRVTGVRIAKTGARDIATDISANAVVMAAGGSGQLYSVTTNPTPACGDALAIAARTGAIIADAEFVQFHPTAINIGLDPAPLATEALRGEGALLLNSNGERFMTGVHDDAELAPRDIVARSVHREIEKGRNVFLDCRTAIGRKFAEKFPTVQEICLKVGINPVHDLIPVAPAAHYHMGGILTDSLGRSSLNGLWACGEAASTGLHGANRLASNSLLEALVMGARIAKDLGGFYFSRLPITSGSTRTRKIEYHGNLDEEQRAIDALRNLMTAHVGVTRTQSGLQTALRTFDTIRSGTVMTPKLENMIITAEFITMAALNRRESRGGHFRADYTQSDEAQRHRTYMTSRDLTASKNQLTKAPKVASLSLVHSQ